MAKICFDTEFTGLQKDTDLISIGLKVIGGETYYAEITDYRKDLINDWIQENVIDNLSKSDEELQSMADVTCKGTFLEVRKHIKKWLNTIDRIEWVSDCYTYDFMLLIDLAYGHGLSVPYGKVAIACHELNQDIAKYMGIDDIEAADVSREEFLQKHGVEIKGKKHNAMYDAIVIEAIYKKIQGGDIDA